MQAIQVVELSGPEGIRLVRITEPTPGDGVLVEVHSIGVRYADLLRSKGLYQERSEPPYVPFGEVAGVVVEAPTASRFRPGDRVAGSANAAGAELAVAAESSLYRLPQDLTFDQGAGMTLNYETAIFGLEPARTGYLRRDRPGAWRGRGERAARPSKSPPPWAAGSSLSYPAMRREHVARQAGATEVLRASGPWREEAVALTGGRGVDMVWDPVGGDRARLIAHPRARGPVDRHRVRWRPDPELPPESCPPQEHRRRGCVLQRLHSVPTRPRRCGCTSGSPPCWVQGRSVRSSDRSSRCPMRAAALRMLESRRAVGKVVIRVR